MTSKRIALRRHSLVAAGHVCLPAGWPQFALPLEARLLCSRHLRRTLQLHRQPACVSEDAFGVTALPTAHEPSSLDCPHSTGTLTEHAPTGCPTCSTPTPSLDTAVSAIAPANGFGATFEACSPGTQQRDAHCLHDLLAHQLNQLCAQPCSGSHAEQRPGGSGSSFWLQIHFGPRAAYSPMASPEYSECPWNTDPWSCTEDSSDTAPDPTASSAHDEFFHSHALSRVSLAPASMQPTLPMPQPKAPPPQHLLSNAARILPPLPAGPRHGVNTPFTPPMRTFCARYQNARCRRQCSLHMTPMQRTHAHVFALHGLPVAALLPPLVRWRCLASLSHILSNIWTCLFPASQHALQAIDWWTASDCRWYLARLPISSEPEIGSSTSASDC